MSGNRERNSNIIIDRVIAPQERVEETLVRGDRYSPVRRGAFVCFLLLLGISLGPEIAGVGSPGIGGGQCALLLLSGMMILVSGFLGRMDGRYLLVCMMTLGTLSMGIAFFTASDADVGWMLWRMKTKVVGVPSLAIHEDDSVLGWVNRPMSHAVDDHYDYRVEYHIGPRGERINRNTLKETGQSRLRALGEDSQSKVDSVPWILCLGGSFTFGQGVEDAETFAARLEELFGGDLRIVNGGVNGWGTVQVMLQVKKVLSTLESTNSGPLPQAIVYGFLPIHANRNSDRESWLTMISQSGRNKPLVAMSEAGSWDFLKLVGAGEGREDCPELDSDEARLTLGCIAQMDRMCRDKGVSFSCVLLGEDRTESTPEEITCKAVGAMCQGQGIAFVDCTDSNPDRFPHDGHPTAQWHQDISLRLKERLVLPEDVRDHPHFKEP